MPNADTGYASFEEHVAALAGGAGDDVEAGNDAVPAEAGVEAEAEQAEVASTAEPPAWQKAIDALASSFTGQMEALAARLAPSAPAADPVQAAEPPKSLLHRAARDVLGEHATDEQVEEYVQALRKDSGWQAFGEGQPEAAQARETLQAKQALIQAQAEVAQLRAELRAQREELSDPAGPFGMARAEHNRRSILNRLDIDKLGEQLPTLAADLRAKTMTLEQVLERVDFGGKDYEAATIAALDQTEAILKAKKLSTPELPAAPKRTPGNPLTGAPSGLAGGSVGTEPEGYADFDAVTKQVRRDFAREMN